jgi:hypothetical protein
VSSCFSVSELIMKAEPVVIAGDKISMVTVTQMLYTYLYDLVNVIPVDVCDMRGVLIL